MKWLPKPPVDNPAAEAKDQAGMKPYTEKISGTDVTFDMVPIPGGTFKMGSPAGEKGRKNDEGPQVEVKLEPFWMEKHEVTWNEYSLWGLGLDKQRREAKKLSRHLGQAGRRRGDSHQAVFRHDLRHGQGGLSGGLHDPVRRQDVLQVAFGQDGPLLPPADRGRMGICLPRGHQDGLLVRRRSRQARRLRLVCRQQRRKVSQGRPEEAQSLGALRHARQRGRVVPRPVRADRYKQLARQGGRKSVGTGVTKCVSAGGARRRLDRRGATLRSAARRGSSKEWKTQDPQIPQSIWYYTDADFVGFRVVRPLRVPTPEEAARYELTEFEKQEFLDYKKAQAGKQ